jgi:flavin reductase (DIM6/NTAB) family NADH-FMN oxidoreductase RutF
MNEEAKKDALRFIPYGLYIVGVRNPQVEDPPADLNAFIASWVSQCSFKPPMLMMGVRKASRSYGMIKESRVFTVNMVGTGQKSLAQTFLKDLTIDDRAMSGVAYRLGETGAPILPEAPAFVECELVEIHDDGGDHAIVVGRVVAAGYRPDPSSPLTHEEAGWHYGG